MANANHSSSRGISPTSSKSASIEAGSSHQEPTANESLRKTAEEAVHIVEMAMEFIDQFRGLFVAISEIGDEKSTKLAKVGKYLSDDWHNLLDCEREDLEGELQVIGEVSHV